MYLASLTGYVLFALQIAVLATTVYTVVHAAMQRPDAYTAVDKLTKPVWLAILGGGAVLGWIIGPPVGAAIAACATGVYLVDVKPKLLEVQGKSR